MSAQLTFNTNPMSRARVARWMLEETGLLYDTVVLDYGTTMKAPAFRAINPMGKVPALTHGDTVITENAAICMYLADLVPEKQLAPPVGSPARGPYYRWISFMGPLEQLMVTKSTGGPLAEPAIDTGYFTDAHDQAVTLAGLRLARKIAATAPLADLIVSLAPSYDTIITAATTSGTRVTGSP